LSLSLPPTIIRTVHGSDDKYIDTDDDYDYDYDDGDDYDNNNNNNNNNNNKPAEPFLTVNWATKSVILTNESVC
jgi:hypothetical protein